MIAVNIWFNDIYWFMVTSSIVTTKYTIKGNSVQKPTFVCVNKTYGKL